MSTKTVSPAIRIGKAFNYKWPLGLVMVTVITLGWKYPLLGFVVPVAMGAGVLGSLMRGRWVCGNACPRGSFLDTWMSFLSANREIPTILKSQPLRWMTLIALMGLMIFRLSQDLGSMAHWGYVFWQMCLVTTILAVGLGLRYAPRSWCSFCPVGTMSSSIGGENYPLQIHSSCRTCGICEKSCPLQLAIARYKEDGILGEKDCLKCSTCITACPKDDVLSWPTRDAV